MIAQQFQNETRCAVSVKDMAAMCGLSRQRFSQLVKAGVFPTPHYDVLTKRPFFPEESQKICLEVRRRNFGINGKAILFYSRRVSSVPTRPKTDKTPKVEQHPEILDGLKSLGLGKVTANQVAEAMKQMFPAGTGSTEQSEVVRAVFIHLRRKITGVNVGSK